MNIIKRLGIVLGCALMASSCSEIGFGDDFLGKQPESSGATTEEMFSSRINAEKVITKAYSGLPYGLPTGADSKLGVNILESLTDLCNSFRDNISDGPLKYYYNGALGANNVPVNNVAYRYGGKSDWTTIRYAWLYIENVNKVPDMTAAEKNKRIAEAKMLIAVSYFEMLRYVGGVTWLDHYVDVNETMNFPRITFAKTVENIVALLNDVIASNLEWKQDDVNDGRMTRAGAMALKFKVLQWAASPTFNSETKWHPNADEYTCYGNYSSQRWADAADAAAAFFTELEKASGSYALIQPSADTHEARRVAYREAYFKRGKTETLISTRKGYDANVYSGFIDQRYYTGPTLNYVNMFPWKDGSDFPEDYDWSSPSPQPFFTISEGGKEPMRDPRLYENVACPGDNYCSGTLAPVYNNHPDYKNGSGFLIMKFIMQDANSRSGAVHWAHTRLAEIMLGYAEAINEVNGRPTDKAYQMVNDVRRRVGLSDLPQPMSHDEFLEAVLRERALELGFEEVRWFDLVRRNRKNDFTKKLYGLRTVGNDLLNPTVYTFEKVELNDRYWAKNWDTKWYLAPIPQEEINKGYGMTQNPGW